MPAINVNPTRQELTRLKTRLRTHPGPQAAQGQARRAHEAVHGRGAGEPGPAEEGGGGLMRAHGSFTVASASCPPRCWSRPCSTPSRAWSWT